MEAEKIVELEKKLGIKFPNSYKKFLKDRGSAIVDGFKIAGIPPENVPQDDKDAMDVKKTTGLLRFERPDLPESLVAIIFVETFATCLDLSQATAEDAPLVEVNLESDGPPRPVGGKTFSQWLEFHQQWEKRFRRAWKRIANRQAEAKGKRIQDWSTPIFRVKDYIVAVGAFRFDYRFGCLEVDEFLPIDQPHLIKDEAVKVLLSETFIRARDYCGSLTIQFTQDPREDENGEINPKLEEKRILAPIPNELMELAAKFSISLPHPEKGLIAHQDAVNLWFATFEFPQEVEARITELEKAGYLKKEIIMEVISLGHWAKEEVIWIFLNAPRPEALIMGSDSVEDRPSYVESLNYGRAALITQNLRYAVIAAMNEGFTMEEIEEIKINCQIESHQDFWLLRCNEKFYFHELWLADGASKQWFEANQPILLLCRPHIPASKALEMERLAQYLDLLVKAQESVQAKCLVLSNEYNSPYYCQFLDEMKDFIREAKEKGVEVIFAPTRTDLYLDRDIQDRMAKVKSMTNFPSRQGPKKLQVFAVPPECWKVPEESRASRAIQNAFQSALIFAQQLVQRREVKRYQMEFSLMAEVMEREASENHPLIVELEGEESQILLDALKHDEDGLKGVSFSFVAPDQMAQLIAKIKSKKLVSLLEAIQGGIVVLVKPWEYPYISPQEMANSFSGKNFVLPPNFQKEIDTLIQFKKSNQIYASHWDEIDRAHQILRSSLAEGLPFAIASVRGRVRSGVFTEMVRDYLLARLETTPVMMPIAYGDGSQGESFPLFSLPKIEQFSDQDFFSYNVGLVSLRHQEVDQFVDRFFVRNRDIQNRANGADQEDLAYRKTYECLDELLKYINGELSEKNDLSSSLEILLGWKPELKEHPWQGLNLHIFHASGLEPAGIGTYRAVIDLLTKYRSKIVVVPRILIPSGQYKQGEPWF